MRKIVISVTSYNGKERTVIVVPVFEGSAIVLEHRDEDSLICACCIDQQIATLIAGAAKALRVSSILWEEGADGWWADRPGYAQMWDLNLQHKFVKIPCHNQKGLIENVNQFRVAIGRPPISTSQG